MVIYEFAAFEKPRTKSKETDTFWGNIFKDVYIVFTHSRVRYLLSTSLLCFGAFFAAKMELSSTYVCPMTGSGAYLIPVSQVTGVLFNLVIILGIERLLNNSTGVERKLGMLSSIPIHSAAILSSLSIGSLLYSSICMGGMPSLTFASMQSTFKDGTFLTVALLCAGYLLSQISLLALTIVFVFTWLYTPVTQAAWTNLAPFPPSKEAEAVGFLLLFVGFTTFMHIASISEASNTSYNFVRRISIWIYVLSTISFLVTEGIYLSKNSLVESHPINSLVYNARTDGDRWRVQASSSISLKTAVAEYRRRHRGRAPPSNFDKWYEFAIQRGCPVIDSYDQIDRDLLPFWAIEPAQIRSRSPLQLPSNDIYAIRIRDGQAVVSHHQNTIHSKWSVELTAMIQEFAQLLPDMYIAFDMRDTPRVAVPWKRIDRMKQLASSMEFTLDSADRHHFTLNPEPNSLWPSLEADYSTIELSTRFVGQTPSVFRKLEAPSCPPSSPSGGSRAWHSQGVCASCARPHSSGQFVQNWALAGDLCHQPDMANLHGFLMSPDTAFDPGLLPGQLITVFSRSKIPGYNDILFPSPWDYVDLEQPRPNEKIFSEMANILFWRGPADDSESTSHTWRGMTAQRLAHLVNNITSNSLIPMLLPAQKKNKFIYENVPASDLSGLLNLDIGLTRTESCRIMRCFSEISDFGGDMDMLPKDDILLKEGTLCKTKGCLEQERELGIKSDIFFKEHFDYRYLFDTDVRGASKRFVAFLRSNAVPFRASIFHTWYDDRLTPWLYYVPIDGRLHAVHSTLAYFVGLKGKINGRAVDMPGKFEDAAFIADQGRKWAEKALRREDAEVYLFRLLLEYGRVVDDWRNEIGFRLEA